MSDWRKLARAAIDKALSALPADAPPAQVKKVLRSAYPFGERANHPYTIWLDEQKKALKLRGATGKHGKPAVEYIVTKNGTGLLYVNVSCGWCNLPLRSLTSCLMCCQQRLRVSEIIRDELFIALRDAARDGDDVAQSALADWLEENLGTRCGL